MNFVFGFLLLRTVFSSLTDHPDRVTNLPSAPKEPTFPMYAGFLTATDNNIEHKLFYELCESIRSDPMDSPLLIWLNGGPGSSSLYAFLLSHGPYRLDVETVQLKYNEFSWNQYANVLYLESPSGVGFSHSNTTNNHIYNDITTARINRKAIEDFMTRVHPRYATRDFYITGESYAGVYIPYLAREILNHSKSGEFTNMNIKGIAMGNAHIDNFSDQIASGLQLYSMGMIPQKYGKEVFESWEKILDGKHTTTSLSMQWHVAKRVRKAECVPEDLMEAYMNQEDVQIIFNTRTKEDPAVKWRVHSDRIFDSYDKAEDTIPIYTEILDSIQGDFRILFYTGDMDLICPPLQIAFGASRIADQNGMTEREVPNWYYTNDYGGARTSYVSKDGKISMDVLTVRGSSHSVPINHPDRA